MSDNGSISGEGKLLRLKLISTGTPEMCQFHYRVRSGVASTRVYHEYIVNNAVDSVHGGRKTCVVVLFSVGAYLAKLSRGLQREWTKFYLGRGLGQAWEIHLGCLWLSLE